MANTIRLKRGSGSDPSASDLVVGELAIRTDSGKIFTKKDNGSVAEISGGGGIDDGDKGDITISNGGDTFTIDSGVIDNANIASNAAIAGSKISPDFGSQTVAAGQVNVTSTLPKLRLIDSNNNPSYSLRNNNGTFEVYDDLAPATRLSIDDSKIVSKLNHDFDAGIDVTGNITGTGNLTLTSTDAGSSAAPEFELYRNSASPADADYLGQIKFTGEDAADNKQVYAKITGKADDVTNTTEDGILEFMLTKAGSNNIAARFTSTDLKLINGTGLEVAGNISCDGTVDGVDIAARDTLFGGLTSSSGVLSNGVTATTQSAGNNTTRVATTAFVSTAINNLINGAPAALDTLNELAAAMNDNASFSTTVTNSLATKMPLAGGEFTGNITFSGSQTVDGRDLSVDGSKLDGIESGATADQTASEILTLLKTVDGAGSGLDADTLDGVSSASFVRSDADDTLSGSTYTFSSTHASNAKLNLSGISGSGGYNYFLKAGNDVGNKVTHFVNGSTRSADGGANTYTIRNDGGNLRLGNSSYPTLLVGSGDLTYNGNEVWHAANDGSGSGLDSDTLDGIQASSFLRSDAADTCTQPITFSGGIILPTTGEVIKFGPGTASNDDAHIEWLGGSNAGYLRFSTSDDSDSSGSNEYIEFGDYPTQNRVGTFTQHVRISRDRFLVRTGSNSISQADRLNIDDAGTVDIYGNLDVGAGCDVTGNITVTGTVDGRDVATDGSKLDGIESGATADQTNSEIKTAYEANSNTNAFTDALLSKLNGIAASATNVTNNNQLTNGAGYITATLTNEQVQDIVGAMVSSNTESGISVTYADNGGSAGKLNFSVTSQTDNNFTNADHSKLDGIEAGATADQTASEILTLIKTVDGAGSGLDADTLDGISSASFLRSDASDTMTGTLTIGDGSGQHELHLKKADNNTSDHLQFYNGTTRVGEIGVQDDTWLRINQVTNKNIYTPRYIRADNGFFVDGTSKGINGSGNFIGGTIAGASDYSTLLRSNAADTASGDITFTGGAGAVTIGTGSDGSDIRFVNGTWTGNTTAAKIQLHSNYLYIAGGSNGIIFRENNTNRWQIDGSGHFRPETDSTYDIGTSSIRVRNGYFDNLYGSGANITAINASNISSGTIASARIADDAITAAKIADGAIGAAAIGDDAVGSAELADNAVANSRIQNNAVSTAKIANGAVTNDKINSMAASKLTGALPAIDGSALTGISAGATGGGSDEVFYENGQTVTTNYTITNGKNAMSAGPITINNGVTVTVGSGENLTIV